jgi:succinoglycan biosynthesis transport protein ExoP
LQDEVSRFTGDTKKLGSQSVEIESIKDEIGSAMNIAKMIGDEVETLKIELSAPDRVRVLKEAKAPMAVDMSKRIKFTGMAAGGALVAIILLISFWEVRARKIDSQDDVIRGLGIKVVGTMPAIPRAASRSHSKLSGPQGQLWQYQLSESVETTRIMLMHAARVASYRLVLVTSAVGGEGKTSLSSHLATSLARSGQRTLLIDGDLRRPMVHRLYDQPREPGLCELVRDEAGADAVIRPTAIENLWIIPSGRFDDHALAALSQTRIRAVFDHLRERFDFVIVDSAPVLPVADTLLLCQHVDAALFSVLRDVSQLPKVQTAYQRIASLEVPILGAVVSGTEVVSDYRYAEWS